MQRTPRTDGASYGGLKEMVGAMKSLTLLRVHRISSINLQQRKGGIPLVPSYLFAAVLKSFRGYIKGDDNTFGAFPEHLRALLSHALPKISVAVVTYPTFETRGDLSDCVSRFREWYGYSKTNPGAANFAEFSESSHFASANKVIDLEVSAGTPSPTIDPSVRVVLVGHSMGGIVAAETLLSITSDPPIPPPSPTNSTSNSTDPLTSTPEFMFPYIQGLLAFDTPYLGISPSVIAHGAESHYKSASSAYSNLSELAGAFGWGAGSAKSPPSASPAPKSLPAGPESAKDVLSASMTDDAAATPAWQRWGKYAMFAGAAGAVAAGGAAAYLKRERISAGWSWAGSHLEFVGCLVRGEELQSRLSRLVNLHRERAVGFTDLVTVLGQGAAGGSHNEPKTFAGGWVEVSPGSSGLQQQRSERTFCTVPKTDKMKRCFEKAVNDKAVDEIKAHMGMFFPRDNPGYYTMSERAKQLIAEWVDLGWYQGSEGVEVVMQDDKFVVDDERDYDHEKKEGTRKGDEEIEKEKERGEDEEDMEASLGGEAPVFVVDEGNVWRDA
ncbi:MAG: hypothetical protein Q9191_003125 [Dirinaria sp. TL-2023a]